MAYRRVTDQRGAEEMDQVRRAYIALGELIEDALMDGRARACALSDLESSLHWAITGLVMELPADPTPGLASLPPLRGGGGHG